LSLIHIHTQAVETLKQILPSALSSQHEQFLIEGLKKLIDEG
jgi:hypothetical protein